MKKIYDLIIIGAGPAGLSSAYSAKVLGLDYLVIESEQIANTVRNYPLGKPLFSTPNELEFEPGTLLPAAVKPTREEVLNYYDTFVKEKALNIQSAEKVERIVTDGDGFLSVISKKGVYRTSTVIIAIGGMGIQNRLEVEGEEENQDHISYLFHEGEPFAGKRVLVVGGGNSAAEAALFLNEKGALVTFAMRRSALAATDGTKATTIKPWVRQPLEAEVSAGRITLLFSTKVLKIKERSAVLEVSKEIREIECDHVFALLGARPDLTLLIDSGIEIEEDGRPRYNPETFETNVDNIYVLGHLTRELHMKNATQLPPITVKKIAEKLQNSRLQIQK